MRLDFNVLWVEDQPEGVEAQIKAIQRSMASEGFELKHTMCTKFADVESRLADDLFKDEVDLIMVDWDLGRGLEGQTVITKIREYIYYKDIIFYSAVTNIQELKKASASEGHEGIYFVQRQDLVNEVSSIFRSMIKKVLDLDHARGIVMGATSDIDHMARECLRLAHEMLDESGRGEMLSEMLLLLDEKVPNLEKRVGKLRGTPCVDKIVSSHFTFTANDVLRILKRVLEGGRIGEHAEFVDEITVYINDVVPGRNRLGHQVLSPEGRPKCIAATDGAEITLEELRELRKKLLDARQKFRELHSRLSIPEGR